jgi:hypothetical protein
MAGRGAVMVPCEVPAPQHGRTSYYKSLLAKFLVGEDASVLVAIPGRRSKAVAEGFRYARRSMGAWEWVEVAQRKDGVFLVRKSRP